jgi:hypothetical protein
MVNMKKSKVIEKEQVEYKLTAHDRCDRCQAQAYVSASGVNGELFFCSHHFNKYSEELVKWSYDIVDERIRLQENKLTGSEN